MGFYMKIAKIFCLYFLLANIIYCKSYENQSSTTNQSEKKLDITLEGASISQGIGASFSLQTRLMAHLRSQPILYSKLTSVFKDKKVGIIFDHFFISNFPFWSPLHNNVREELVHQNLKKIDKNYDIVFYALLPNESMLYENKAKSKKQWDDLLKSPASESIRNIMSSHWLATIASFNPLPKRVRDQINRKVHEYTQERSEKFIEMPLDSFLQSIVKEKGVISKNTKIAIPKIFNKDKLHLSDIGQAILLNRVILKAIEQFAENRLKQKIDIAKINELPSSYTKEWRNNLRKKYFGSLKDFLAYKDGEYLLQFESKKIFTKSIKFYQGDVPEKNYPLSKQRFRDIFPHVIRFLVYHIDLTIPIKIDEGEVTLDMRKSMQSGTLQLSKNETGIFRGVSRDFWLAMGFMTTNNLYEIRHIGNGKFDFTLTLLPLLNFQKPGLIRNDKVSHKVKDEILNNTGDYNRIVLSGSLLMK